MNRVPLLLGWAAVGGLLAPLVVAGWVSFSPDSFLTPPTADWSLRWHRAFWEDRRWATAVLRGIGVAATAATLSVLAAVPAAFAVRHRFPGRRLATGGLLLPAYLPAAVLGLGAVPVFAAVGLRDASSGMALVHATLGLPVAFLVVRSQFDARLSELTAAARGLGASPWQAARRVTLPLLCPVLAAAWVSAFVLSLNEVTVSLFLASPSSETVSAVAWSELRFAVTPKVAVAAGWNAVIGIATIALVIRFGRMRSGRHTDC